MTAKKNELAPLTRELLTPREQAALDYKHMIDEIVRERIAEIMAAQQAAELEPFFRTKEVSNAMRRNQSVTQQNGWHWYYEDHGCLHCHKADTPHYALGMCGKCFGKIRERRKASIRLRELEPGRETTFRDTVQIAREALLPSIEKLAKRRKRG